MTTRRARFNWFTLNRGAMISSMLSLAPEVVNKQLTISQFHYKITKNLRTIAPLRFRRLANYKVESNQAWVGGTYYSDRDIDKKKCIEIVLVYSLFDETICITKKRFTGLCHTIADTILHELIHMRQYRRRKFKIIPEYDSTAEKSEVREEQSYLGCSDEIDAYGFNIACELIDKFKGNHVRIITYLSENQQGKRRRHNSWRMYLKAFQHDHNHPIIQRLKKKIVGYLPQAYLGKPYRNKEWIYY